MFWNHDLSTQPALFLSTDNQIWPPFVSTHIWGLSSCQHSGGPSCGCHSHSFVGRQAHPDPVHTERVVGTHGLTYNPTLPCCLKQKTKQVPVSYFEASFSIHQRHSRHTKKTRPICFFLLFFSLLNRFLCFTTVVNQKKKNQNPSRVEPSSWFGKKIWFDFCSDFFNK